MNLFEDTNPRALKDLLTEIHNRTAVLPDFQRDFVWEPGATQELIVSIASNYPAGSILRVRDAKRVFAAREFEGAPPLDGAKHTFLVLDGQQRLTSLYQAFYGVGEHRYFLDLRKLTDGADFEEAIFHVRASTKWAKAREDFTLQAKELLLPLSVLKGGAGGFLQWILQVTNPMPAEERTRMLDALTRLNENWIRTIDDYHFPVVTLSDQTESDALCTIFETLNRTGVKLSVFELLTARFWPHNLKLRALWEKALADHPVIAAFEVDPYYVLQGISLASRKAPSCKRSDVLNMDASDITDWWDKVVLGLATGVEILRDDCKVMLPKWLPYQTMLPPRRVPGTPRCRVGALARLRAQPHAHRPHHQSDDQRPSAVRLPCRDPQHARVPLRKGAGLARSARGRGVAAPARRLRGVSRVAAGTVVAGDPARHGRDGGRRSRSRRQGPGMKARKKLIEVARPLDVTCEASAWERSIRTGHSSTLHSWWARRPLGAVNGA